MRLPSWLRPLVARPNRNSVRRASKRPTWRPRVETLEDRITPSGGALDPTFGTGGIVTVPVDTNSIRVVNAVQADGKILSADYLGRMPAPSEVGFWVNVFESGESNETVIAGFISSPEYFKGHSDDTADWLYDAYEAILGRAPNSAGLQGWLKVLDG
jgi:hypothetical protein